MDDQEDAGSLQFDIVWKNAQCLNICEVEQLLKVPYLQGEASGATKQHLETAFKHSRRFGKLKDSQALQELRMALEDWEAPSTSGSNVSDSKLAAFEQAQLVNLVPSDSEEAKALIPSLFRFSSIDITGLLDTIGSFMRTAVPAMSQNYSLGGSGTAPLSYHDVDS
jgi:DNA-directed RNA polymerase II subunit RPB4